MIQTPMRSYNQIVDFWSHARNHIKPSGPDPEEFNVYETIKEMTGESPPGMPGIVDFGCGVGRLTGQFPAAEYTGVDTCPRFLEEARRKNPGYRFVDGPAYPIAGIYFAHTVFLHLTDDEVIREVLKFPARQVLVGEIMDPSYANLGHYRVGGVMTYNRPLRRYVELMDTGGYKFVRQRQLPYNRYGTPFTYALFQTKGSWTEKD